MTIRFEGYDGLPDVVKRFLRHKASIPELKKALEVRRYLRISDKDSASSKTDKLLNGGDESV